MAKSRVPLAGTQIGTGFAQVLDTGLSAEQALRQQELSRQRKAKESAARAKALEKGMVELRKTIEGVDLSKSFARRDGDELLGRYNNLLKKYEGRMEEVYKDPAIRREFMTDYEDLKVDVARSAEDKKQLAEVQKLYQNDTEGNYTADQKEAFKNALLTPFDETDFNYLMTPQLNIPSPYDQLDKNINKFKTSRSTKIADETTGQITESLVEEIDFDALDNYINVQYGTNRMFKAGVDKFYEQQAKEQGITSLEAMMKDSRGVYSAKKTKYGREPLARGGDTQISFNPTNATDIQTELVGFTTEEHPYSGADLKFIQKVKPRVQMTPTKSFKGDVPFSDRTYDITTGKAVPSDEIVTANYSSPSVGVVRTSDGVLVSGDKADKLLAKGQARWVPLIWGNYKSNTQFEEATTTSINTKGKESTSIREVPSTISFYRPLIDIVSLASDNNIDVQSYIDEAQKRNNAARSTGVQGSMFK